MIMQPVSTTKQKIRKFIPQPLSKKMRKINMQPLTQKRRKNHHTNSFSFFLFFEKNHKTYQQFQSCKMSIKILKLTFHDDYIFSVIVKVYPRNIWANLPRSNIQDAIECNQMS